MHVHTHTHINTYTYTCISTSSYIYTHIHTNTYMHDQHTLIGRALEILKSESVQPMTMTSSMSPFPKKKNMYISHVMKTNDNWQSYNYNSF